MMLQTKAPDLAVEQPGTPLQSSDSDSIFVYLNIIRRQFPLVIAVLSGCLLLGLLYLFAAPAKFTSNASLVIDTRKVQLFQQQSILGDIAVDASTVTTQVEILKSENVSLSVIRDLGLTQDPEFTGIGAGVIGAILEPITKLFTSAPPSEFELTRTALAQFEKQRSINRIGLTYVMEIGFTSVDPEKAARITNAIADAYIVDQLEAKYQATRRASVWLQDRIAEIRTQATEAQKAVVDFRQANNIVDTGGRLINEQQVAEVSSQLTLARAATAEARARLDRVSDILKQEIPDASVADALKNETIIKLRGQYVEFASRESIWAAKYGSDHMATVALRTQMTEIRKNIIEELRRIQESYKSDYDIAQARELSLKSSLSSVISETQLTNQAQVQLRELESKAQSFQAMYDNFLQRYMESVQQQSFPITEARIISPASRSMKKSSPQAFVVLAASLFAGLLLSVGAAIGREAADSVFRTTDQVEHELQTNCIAIVPSIGHLKSGDAGLWRAANSKLDTGKTESGLLRYSIDSPLSRFSESLRSIKVAMDLNAAFRENRILAVTSTQPNEGKSTISTNLAQQIAHSGATTILIDGDLRNGSLSASLGSNRKSGLIDVLFNNARLEDVLIIDPITKLAFLPTGDTAGVHHTNEILASSAMKELVNRLKLTYSYVILDTPPIAPVVDVRVTSEYVDAYLFVVEWGRTSINAVKHALKSAPEIYDQLLGVVLNKADTSALSRYQSYQGKYHYRKYYGRYGYED